MSERKPYGFSLNPNIVEPFKEICNKEGWWMSRQIEFMMLKFIEKRKLKEESK